MIELCIIEDDLVNFLSKIEWGSTIGYLVGIGGLILTWWNVHKSNQKPKARLRLSGGKKEITFTPHYYNKTSTKYYIVPYPDLKHFDRYHDVVEQYQEKHKHDNVFLLPFRFSNTGKLQLENYRVEIEFYGGIQSISLPIEPVPFMSSWGEKATPKDLKVNFSKQSQIVYSPEDEHPLNQNDHKDFAFLFTPHVDVEKIELYWRIIAKDFSDNGKFIIHLKPYVTEYDEIIPVYTKAEVPEGAETVEDLTPYTKQFEEP